MSKRNSVLTAKANHVDDPEVVKEALQNPRSWSLFQAMNDFSSITVLSLQHQAFTTLPHLLKCSNLEHLDLSHNSITKAYPNTLPSRLQSLNLSHNRLRELCRPNPTGVRVVSCLAGKTKLRVLDLSFNRLSGVDDALRYEFEGLRVLRLENNRITDRLEALQGMKNLKELCLANNQLQVADEIEPLKNCTKLQVLDLSQNPIILNGRSLNQVIQQIGEQGMTVCKLLLTLDLGGVFENSSTDCQIGLANTLLGLEEDQEKDFLPDIQPVPETIPLQILNKNLVPQISLHASAQNKVCRNPFGLMNSSRVNKTKDQSQAKSLKSKDFRISSKENLAEYYAGSAENKSSIGLKTTNHTNEVKSTQSKHTIRVSEFQISKPIVKRFSLQKQTISDQVKELFINEPSQVSVSSLSPAKPSQQQQTIATNHHTDTAQNNNKTASNHLHQTAAATATTTSKHLEQHQHQQQSQQRPSLGRHTQQPTNKLLALDTPVVQTGVGFVGRVDSGAKLTAAVCAARKCPQRFLKNPVMLCAESAVKCDLGLLAPHDAEETSELLRMLQHDVTPGSEEVPRLKGGVSKLGHRFSLIKITR